MLSCVDPNGISLIFFCYRYCHCELLVSGAKFIGHQWRGEGGRFHGSGRDVWEYVSVDHSACTSVCLVIVGNAGVGFEFPGGKTLFVSSFDEVVGVV